MSRLAEALRHADQSAPAGVAHARTGEEVFTTTLRVTSSMPTPSQTPLSRPQMSTQPAFQRGVNSGVGKLVTTPTVPPAAVEQYRRLAASMHHAQLERETRVLMVTSAAPGEGKTLTSANLALTLSESYRRNVLLIDADLRRPSVHQVFQIPNIVGLTDVLRNEDDEKLPLIQVSENLTVLPAGRPDPDPIAGLTSDRMRRIVEEAAARHDWLIIDTPPVGFLSDANLLATMVDAVLFVVRANKSPYSLVHRALEAVGRDRILGVVLNAVDENVDVAGYSYYDYYGLTQGQK